MPSNTGERGERDGGEDKKTHSSSVMQLYCVLCLNAVEAISRHANARDHAFARLIIARLPFFSRRFRCRARSVDNLALLFALCSTFVMHFFFAGSVLVCMQASTEKCESEKNNGALKTRTVYSNSRAGLSASVCSVARRRHIPCGNGEVGKNQQAAETASLQPWLCAYASRVERP